ncbi:MAG: hypothetical protein ACRDYE_10100 [Acidimicrobiales bacterium]
MTTVNAGNAAQAIIFVEPSQRRIVSDGYVLTEQSGYFAHR